MVDDGHDRLQRGSEDEEMDAGSMTPGAGRLPGSEHPDAVVPASSAQPRRTRRTGIVLGSAIALIAALALVAVAITSRPPAEFAPGTPEQAFQAYLSAWDEQDLPGAYAQFSDRVRAGLTLDQYRLMARDWWYDNGAERRVVLLRSTVRDDRATLDLRIDEQSGGGLFGADSVWSRPLTIDLVRDGASWHLDQAMAGLEPIWYEK
jgi:hypothetical protein